MRADRLLKLADHLENGKLGHKYFSFNTYNKEANFDHPCGTSGCAIGECPIVFPEDWHFDPNKSFLPTLKGIDSINDSTLQFFEINDEEENLLFLPDESSDKSEGATYDINGVIFEYLSYRATKEQVTEQIRDFVKAKEKV